MRFTLATAVAVFGATAFAQTAFENIKISDFSAQKSETDGSLLNVNFKLDGGEATGITCTSDAATTLPQPDTPCSDKAYMFSLSKGAASELSVKITHDSKQSGTLSGSTDVAANCRAGGSSRQVCTQSGDINFILSKY
ncbi:hypothetical protein SLS62_006879 [Diatrype stigma]|uniref:AA1-like domain-containing protein n=1 Tax=Diatrype stigma TaxID=117547 RepID=A0AAN9UM43_9PEZI